MYPGSPYENETVGKPRDFDKALNVSEDSPALVESMKMSGGVPLFTSPPIELQTVTIHQIRKIQ